MRLTIAGLSALLLIGTYTLCDAEQNAPPLTNADVVALTEAGLPEETILLSVQSAPADFETGAQDLIALQKAGVSNAVMKAMIARNSAAGTTAPALGAAQTIIVVPGTPNAVPQVANQAPPLRMQPIAIDGDNRVGLKRAIHDYKYDMGQRGMTDETNETHVIIPGERSDIRLGNGAATIEVPLGTVTLRPQDQLFLLRLDAERGVRKALTEREVEVKSVGGTTLLGGGAAGYVATAVGANVIGSLFRAAKAKKAKASDPRVPIRFTEVPDAGEGGVRLFHVTPEEPLPEGEYAVRWDGEYWDFGVD